MIRLIEALNYRCLRYVCQPLEPFHVLVGPNASGKTTFLDTIAFLGRLVSDGLDAAIDERSKNFRDLVWGREDGSFELAIEAKLDDQISQHWSERGFDTIRYEIAIGSDSETHETQILAEKAVIKAHTPIPPREGTLFPDGPTAPSTILTPKTLPKAKTIIRKVRGGNDNFYSETYKASGKGWAPAFRLGPRKSALGNLPEDESKFPASTWLKRLLTEGVRPFVLNSLYIRKASPPGQPRGFKADGSNLPWVVDLLRRSHPDQFSSWLQHVRTALPDLENIETVERADDRHRYLVLEYSGGLKIPSWMASDGTLRLLALTLPAYLPDFQGIYLIEEPENGIHPRAVDTMYQSLSSVYSAQMLLATHSPVILGAADVENVLCFGKSNGATDIVRGDEHPALRSWQGETNLGVLFAAGVLGQ